MPPPTFFAISIDALLAILSAMKVSATLVLVVLSIAVCGFAEAADNASLLLGFRLLLQMAFLAAMPSLTTHG